MPVLNGNLSKIHATLQVIKMEGNVLFSVLASPLQESVDLTRLILLSNIYHC